MNESLDSFMGGSQEQAPVQTLLDANLLDKARDVAAELGIEIRVIAEPGQSYQVEQYAAEEFMDEEGGSEFEETDELTGEVKTLTVPEDQVYLEVSRSKNLGEFWDRLRK